MAGGRHPRRAPRPAAGRHQRAGRPAVRPAAGRAGPAQARPLKHGVWLGRQGVPAGVGDLLQAHRNDWDLAPGSREPPRLMNRGPSASPLFPTTARSRSPPTPAGMAGGDWCLPAAHRRTLTWPGRTPAPCTPRGATVDTTHAVISPTAVLPRSTWPCRGDTPANPRHHPHRPERPCRRLTPPPRAAPRPGRRARDHPSTPPTTPPPRAATRVAEDSTTAAASTRTAAELLADAATFAATERTAATPEPPGHRRCPDRRQRSRLAAEDRAATLTRVLRRAELAD
ncbi:hypothetical protein HBB16_13230 [Pseudonocardia sp. MCCB 268]|nr:hypothetical protein [Pseudonocardia cytotoxica]